MVGRAKAKPTFFNNELWVSYLYHPTLAQLCLSKILKVVYVPFFNIDEVIMAFTAIHKKSDTKINILKYGKNPKADLFERFKDSFEFVCGYCRGKMHIREPHVYRPHFAHMPSTKECSMYEEWHVDKRHYESREHAEAVEKVIKTLISQHKSYYANADIDVEYSIPMDYRPKGRVADIFVKLYTGDTIIHEVQLARITQNEIQQRTKDYEQAEVSQVIWWLGENAATEEIKSYFYDTTGCCNTLHFTKGYKEDYSMQFDE